LEAEYRRRRVVYRKISPVAVLCASDRSPFAPRPGSTVVERFKLCNIGSCLDCWAIKESNFVETYEELPTGAVYIHDDYILHGSPDGEGLRELVCHALGGGAASASAASTAGGWAAADWAAVRAKLASERARAGPGHTWRLAVPKNHVVAVRLTDEVLRACMSGLPAGMSHLGVALADGAAVYREETYAPGYAEFRVGDYAVRFHACFGGCFGGVFSADALRACIIACRFRMWLLRPAARSSTAPARTTAPGCGSRSTRRVVRMAACSLCAAAADMPTPPLTHSRNARARCR
jgi:hypothetical protein